MLSVALRVALNFALVSADPPVADHPHPKGTSSAFTKLHLTEQFFSEGAAFGDLNKDGKPDVVSGPHWWSGPDFKTRGEIYPIEPYEENGLWFAGCDFDPKAKDAKNYRSGPWPVDAYSDNFFAFTDDINGDGWTDVLVLGFPGRNAAWYENPAGKPKSSKGHWVRHVVMNVVDNESPTFLDIDGDGKKEIICSTLGRFGFAKPGSDPTQLWKFTPITPPGPWQRFTHGLGVGDVNGDGKMDLLEKDGWWEQPAAGAASGLWTLRKFPFSAAGGAQMFAYDLDGDGDHDVLTSLEAHGWGYVWYENTGKAADGGVTFKMHRVMGKTAAENAKGVFFSQLHAQDLVDMDGDGLKDVVIGKRKWAHGRKGDPDPLGAPVLYWFKLSRAGGKVSFEPTFVDDNTGVGTQVAAGDLNGDGKGDIVVGNKLGTFVLLSK